MPGPPSTPWERAQLGRELRRSGLSYGEIADIVPAAKAIVAGWCKWVAGLILYWAEGTKTDNRLSLTNSDPSLLRMFMGWVAMYLAPEASYAHVVLHATNDEPAARTWWSTELGLEETAFIKSYITPDGTGHRKNHLEHGVCQLRVRQSTDALHTVKGWINGYRGLVDNRTD